VQSSIFNLAIDCRSDCKIEDRRWKISMFLLDSLMINGISWALRTVVTAADAEMNDDTALREQLLAAEMQRDMGEISDEDFRGIERDLLARIRDIKQRRDGGAGPLEFAPGTPLESGERGRLQIEASISGDFHDPSQAPHTTVVEDAHSHPGIVGTAHGQTEQIIDIEPAHAQTLDDTALPLPTATRKRRTVRRKATRATRTTRMRRAARTTTKSKIR
jgi:hypothetical protein